MTEYRFSVPEDRARLIDFINMVFSCSHVPHDFKAFMPKVYADGQESPAEHALALDDSGRIVGAVGLLPGELRMAGEALRTGYIGSVSTHPYARGEGHMKRLMAMVLGRAAEAGMDLLMLGGKRQRYGYYGFTRGGACVRYEVNGANLRHAMADVDAAPFTFEPLDARKAWIDRAATLHGARPLRMARPRADYAAILRTEQASPHAVLKRGAFAGTLVASRDRGEVYECMLEDDADIRPALKAWMLREGLREAQIPVAPLDLPLHRALRPVAESWRLEDSTMLRVLNFPKALRGCLALRPPADGTLSMWIDGEALTVRVLGGVVDVESRAPQDAPRLSAM